MEIWEEKYLEWLNNPKLSSSDQAELMKLDNEEKKDYFYKYLDFGTGGMRGKIGLGTNRINEYTVKRVSQALATYLKQTTEKKPKVVILYDNRFYSKEFANYAAQVFASNGILAYLSDSMRPTPQLSFLVRELEADAGIMITASHNPKEYNGYKIYDQSGGQITLEIADNLTKLLAEITNELELSFMSLADCLEQKKIILLNDEVDSLYIKRVKQIVQDKEKVKNRGASMNILYTPLHGSGEQLIKQSFQALGFTQLKILEEQADGDPAFSTVLSPNPEEKSAFELALKEAKKNNYDFIFATDPDADRMGVVVFDKNNQPILLNGNQIGILLLDFLIHSKLKQSADLTDFFVVKTIVTSNLGRELASQNNLEIRETLTGFKYIGEQIELSEKNQEKRFLFGYEESFGYLIDPFVRDKDAIQAAIIFSEFALNCKEAGITIFDYLINLYEQYGFYEESLETITLEGILGAKKIEEILNSLRKNPFKECGELKVEWVEDYLTSSRVNLFNGEEGVISLPKSNVLKFIFSDKSWICVRPSGTEPKCKIYYSVNAKSETVAKLKLTRLKESFQRFIL